MKVDVIGEAVVPLPVGEMEVVTVAGGELLGTYVEGQLRERYLSWEEAVAGHPRWTTGLARAAWGG
jgi:hypothetical protein